MNHPSIGVVIPTRGERPGLTARAKAAAERQDYPGRVQVLVVGDGAPADIVNVRTPGLAGARNTGIDALDTDLIAFCDDDDEWLPGKLRAQVAALRRRPGADFCSCAIEVEHHGRRTARTAGKSVIRPGDLVESRMVMVHASGFLFRNGAYRVDESAPSGQNEDWDLALRAAKTRPFVHVDRPLVRVRWGRASHFSRDWRARIDGLEWMLEGHPEIARSRTGQARVYGQLAFLHAALGRRREAVSWAMRAMRANPRERRVPVALAVASGAISAPAVLSALHTWGRGV